MSRKVTHINTKDIKKTFSAIGPGRDTYSAKADFKLKKHTGAKSSFGVASACADGVVYNGLATKD